MNNSAYTNQVTKLALEFAVEAAGVLGITADVPTADWTAKAQGLYIPFEEVVPGHPEMKGGYHPEYSNFPGRTVKQADTVMLSYPFGTQMPPQVLANDLSFYTQITSQSGPAMTVCTYFQRLLVACIHELS